MRFATWRRFTAYFDHPDHRVALGRAVALAVASSQPLYPLYVAYAAGGWIGPACVTWLSTPLFLLVPRVARSSPDAGRALLLMAAIGNTVLTAIALGPASGVELFDAPCLLLAALIFPRGRRRLPVLASAVLAGGGFVAARVLTPWAALTPAQSRSLAIMHAVSAAGITGLILIAAWRLARAEARR